MTIFNEESLRADVAKMWGEYGAHIEVLDELIKRAWRSPEPTYKMADNEIVGFDIEWPNTLTMAQWNTIHRMQNEGWVIETCPSEHCWHYTIDRAWSYSVLNLLPASEDIVFVRDLGLAVKATSMADSSRLVAKASGVRLALSYLREAANP